jgi:carbonic anhydrase
MTEIAKMLEANADYVPTHEPVGDNKPRRRVAVVTCMDARIDVFAALGLGLGDAHVLRNAGGRVTDDVLRSLALSTHVLGVDTVVLMQHTRCGLSGVTDEELREVTGAVDVGFLPIDDHVEALRQDLDLLKRQPYLDTVKLVAGFVYDVDTGAIQDVHRWPV